MNNRRFSGFIVCIILSLFTFINSNAQNPCGFSICDPIDIRQHFEDAGFGQIDVEIGEEITALQTNQDVEKKSSSTGSITEDYANNSIKINQEFVSLAEIMDQYAEVEVALQGLEGKLALITDNDYFCECHEETCDIINGQFTSPDKDVAYWFHIWRSDPLDTQGILFYGGNMGFDGGKFTPSSIEHQTAINDQIDDILADINTYSYSNKESHLISSLSFSLLDVWEMYSETDPPEGPVAQNVELDCDGFTSGQHTYLSPAGVAMVFPENIRPGFDKKDEWKAKGPVYAYRELATNQLVCGWFLPSSDLSFQGYRNRTTNKDIEYDAWPVGSLNVPARLGNFDEYQASNGDNCTTFSLYDIEYTPNISNTTGSGFYIGDVDEQGTVIYTSPFYQDFTYCINTLSFNGTESYLSFTGSDEDPVSPTLNPVGLQMIVDHPDLGNIHVYIRHEYGLGDMDPVPDYIYWDNQVCAWRGLPVGYEMPPDVFWAILQVMYEVSTGHGVWDAAAAVPVIGAPIDVVNAVWYSLEGDATNASLAIVGLAIDIKVVKEGVKYIIKLGGDVIIALAKRFGDEVTGYYPEGIKLSEMLKVLSDKYPNDDVSEIGQDMLNFVLNKLPDDVIQKFNDIPALANVWDEARKLDLIDDDKVKLFIDLVDNPNLLDEFVASPTLVKSWDVFKTRPVLRKDIATLAKMLEIADNPTLVDKFPNGIEDLRAIGNVVVHPCCGNTHPWLKDVTEHIDDIKHFLENHAGVTPGYEETIHPLKNSLFAAQDGASHMLTKLRLIPPADVVELEGKIVDADNLLDICVNCLFDIKVMEVVDGSNIIRKLELKSYQKSTIEGLGSSSTFKNQFTAYLGSINNVDELEYIFNGNKSDVTISLLKENFKKVYEASDYKIFDDLIGSELFETLDISTLDDFIEYVDDLDSDFYKFLTIL